MAPAAPAASGGELAHQAWQHYQRATQAARDGQWATYGEETRLLGEVLGKLAGPGDGAGSPAAADRP